MASWQAASYSLINWPSSVIMRRMQICCPKHLVIRLASVVLPLPRAPYKNIPAQPAGGAQRVEQIGLDADPAERGGQLLAHRLRQFCTSTDIT